MADGEKIGDAYVEVHMDVDKPIDDAAKKVEKAGPKLKKAGAKAGKDGGDGVIKGTLAGMDAGNGEVVKKSGEIGKKAGSETAKKAEKEIKRETPKISKAALAMFASLPAAGAVAGAATGASLAAIPLIFGGIAAAAVSSNKEVKTAFSDLSDEVVDDVKKMSSPLRDDFIGVADRASAAWQRSLPQLRSIFGDLDDGIREVSDGAIGLAENALPGMAKATHNAQPEFRALNSLMQDTGTGVSDFFTSTTKGSAGAARILTGFGTVVKDALGFAGDLFAKVATYGAGSFDSFEHALSQTEDTVLALAQGALPVLGAATTTVFGGFTAILRVLQPITPALGKIATTALISKTAFGAMNLVSFGNLEKSLEGVKKRVKDAQGFGGKASAAIGGLGSAAGIAGIASLGLGIALDVLAQKQQEAAERAQRVQDAVTDLTDAMDKGAGITTGTYLVALNKVGAKIPGLSYYLQQTGSNLSTASDMAIKGGDAWDQYANSLKYTSDIGFATQIGNDKLRGGLDELRQSQIDAVRASTLHELALRGLRSTGIEPVDEALITMAQSTGAADVKNVAAHKSTEVLATAMQTLSSDTADADTKLQALITVMDQYTGRTPDVEEATQSVNADVRNLKDMTKAWTDNLKGSQIQIDRHGMSLKAWAASLINADGTINTTTESGSEFQDVLVQTQTDLYSQVTAMHETGASHVELVKKVQATRDAFIQQATKMGFTKQQAVELANKYGLIPDKVATRIEGNDKDALGAIGNVRNQLKNLNGSTAWVSIKAQISTANIKSALDKALGHNARGTDYWRGGLTTIAEEGPELVRVGNDVVLAGLGGPTIADVPRGAEITPARQTAQALASPGVPLGVAGAPGPVLPPIILNVYPSARMDETTFAAKVGHVLETKLRQRK